MEAMIAEWHGNRPIQPASSSQRKEVSEGPEAGLSEVADFLADSGKGRAISALEGNLGKRFVDLRWHVVSCCEGLLAPAGQDGPGLPKDVRAVEHLLVSVFDDGDEHPRMTLRSQDRGELNDPRICDAAAKAFSGMAPDTYPFDLTAPLLHRDRAIRDQQYLAQTQGMAPLAGPVASTITRVPDEKLRKLIDDILAARADTAKQSRQGRASRG